MATPVASTSAAGAAEALDLDSEASRSLLSNLQYARANPDSAGLTQNLMGDLEDNEDWLFTPTELPGRIPGFENSLKEKIDKRLIGQDEAKNITNLAQTLNLSEKICSHLLTDAHKASASTGRSDLETAVQLYDGCLLERIECLKMVWEETPDVAEMDIDDYQRVLVTVRDRMYSNKEKNGRALLDPIIKQIEGLQKLVIAILPGAGNTGTANVLQQDLKQYHLRSLRRAQRDLAVVLFRISRADRLTVMEVWDLLLWIKRRERFDEVTIMMLAVLFSAIQSIHLLSMSKGARDDFVTQFTHQILDFDGYKLDWLPYVILLSWGLFLDDAQHSGVQLQIPLVLERLGHRRKASVLVREMAIDNGALGYLLTKVLPSDDKRTLWDAEADRDRLPAWAREEWPMVQDEQRHIVLTEVLDIVRGLVRSPSDIIGTLRRNERDSKQSGVRGGYGRDRGIKADAPENFPAFIELVISLHYELPADCDFTLWEEESLLASLAEGKDVDQQILLARLLLAIGNGSEGSKLLSNTLIGDRVDFTIDQILLSAMDIVQRLKPLQGEDMPRPPGYQATPIVSLTMPKEEEFVLLRAQLLVLVRSLKWNPSLAFKILEHSAASPVSVLWQLVNRPMPSGAKAGALDALAAFARAGVEQERWDVCAMIWVEMEKVCLAGQRDYSGGSSRNAAARTIRGLWLTRLEDQDKEDKGQQARQALIRLFAWMIRGDRCGDTPTEDIAIEAALRRSMVDYVLVETSGEVASLAFEHSSTPALQTMETIAMFAQYCMEMFDPESLVRSAVGKSASSRFPVLAKCLRHAGYYVTEAILGNKSTFNLVTFAASLGHEKITSAADPIKDCLERITQSFLRTLVLLLRAQQTYLEVLLPSIKADRQLVARLDLRVPVSQVALERQLVHTPDRVASIASYTTADVAASLAMLAVQLLAELTDTETFQGAVRSGQVAGNLLVQAVMASPYSQAILSGFAFRLDIGDSTPTSRLYAPSWKSLDNDLMEAVDHAMSADDCKAEVLRFLLKSLRTSTLGLGFTHFLLGYIVDSAGLPIVLGSLHREGTATGLDSPASLMPRSCMHVLVERLLRGTPDPATEEDEGDSEMLLWAAEPEYAVQALEVISVLCASRLTGEVTIRFLRGQENFIMRVMSSFQPEIVPRDASIANAALRHLRQPPKAVAFSTYERFLRIQAQINDITALDLHSGLGGASYAIALGGLLISTDSRAGSGDAPIATSPYLLRSLEALEAEFALTGEVERPGNTFASVDLSAYLVEDAQGCLCHDVAGADRALRAEADTLRKTGTVNDTEIDRDQHVLRSLLERSNAEASVSHATWACLAAWTRLATTYVCTFDVETPLDALAMYELARASLKDLASDAPLLAYRADMLSDVGMQISSSLVRWSGKHNDAADRAQYLLPLEHILDVLELIIKVALKETVPETARGALYTSLIDYINLGLSWQQLLGYQDVWHQLWRPFLSTADQLVGAVARDCLNANEGWRTLAFTLLTLLLDMSGEHASRLVERLDRDGYLQSMAQSLPSTDSVLKSSITSDGGMADTMVYEAKMECLLQLASCTGGATRLARAGVLTFLAKCDFIRAKPEVQDLEMEALEETSFSLSKYFGLLTPVLRLTLSMLQADEQNCIQGTTDFVSSQAEAVTGILADITSGLSPARLEVVLLVATIVDAMGLESDVKATATRPGLKQVRDAMRALPGRFWSRARWTAMLDPVTQEEVEESKIVDAVDGQSLFLNRSDMSVAKIQSLLLRSFIAGTGKAGAFEPVFTVGGQLFANDEPKRAAPGIISLSQATSMLRERADDLVAGLVAVQELREKSEEGAVLLDNEIQEFAKLEPEYTEGLGISDMTGLALLALSKAYEEARSKVAILLSIVEASLVLIDRHISFYADKLAAQAKKQYRFYDPKSSTGPSPDLIQAWKTEINSVLKELQPVFEDLMDGYLAVDDEDEEEGLLLRALVQSLAQVQPFATPTGDMS